jgi:hypothetical protein
MGAPAVAPQRAPARRASARRLGPASGGGSSASRPGPASGGGSSASRPGPPGRRKPRPNSALASRSARAGAARQGVAQPALAGAALIPHAAVRTAGAVRDLSDSSLIVRLTAGRGWIAVLCALLGGIVALNVVSLSINATSGQVSQAIDEYERQNSSLRGELAEQLSAGKVEEAAANLGLAVPAPEDVTYLNSHDGDLARLADALGGDTPLSIDTSSESSYSTEPSSYAGTTSAPSAPTTPPPAASPAPAPSAPTASSGGGAATGGVGL